MRQSRQVRYMVLRRPSRLLLWALQALLPSSFSVFESSQAGPLHRRQGIRPLISYPLAAGEPVGHRDSLSQMRRSVLRLRFKRLAILARTRLANLENGQIVALGTAPALIHPLSLFLRAGRFTRANPA